MAPQRAWRIFERAQAQGHLWERVPASPLPLTSCLMSHSSSLTFPLPLSPISPPPYPTVHKRFQITCFVSFSLKLLKKVSITVAPTISVHPLPSQIQLKLAKQNPPPQQCKHLSFSTTLVYAAVGQTLKGEWDHRGYWPPLRCKINPNLC